MVKSREFSLNLTARELLLGFVYPVILSGVGPSGKAPLIPWEPYQSVLPTPEDIETWRPTYKPSLWGIDCTYPGLASQESN